MCWNCLNKGSASKLQNRYCIYSIYISTGLNDLDCCKFGTYCVVCVQYTFVILFITWCEKCLVSIMALYLTQTVYSHVRGLLKSIRTDHSTWSRKGLRGFSPNYLQHSTLPQLHTSPNVSATVGNIFRTPLSGCLIVSWSNFFWCPPLPQIGFLSELS